MSYPTSRKKRRIDPIPYIVLIAFFAMAVITTVETIHINKAVKELTQSVEELSQSVDELQRSVDELSQAVRELHDKVNSLCDHRDSTETHVKDYSKQEDSSNTSETTAQISGKVVQYSQPSYSFSSDAERSLVERVVAAESQGETQEGQIYVATCIYNTILSKGMTATEVVDSPNQYAHPLDSASDSVKQAVSKVFDDHYKITSEPIMYFYSVKNDFYSSWHENHLTYVCTVGCHKFFKLPG